MNAPDRSADVANWIRAHRALFTGGDTDTVTRALLTPLARALNAIEGRDVWGLLIKTERNPPFIPHDILMWRDTREHFDVFTGPDRVEDVQPAWGYNAAPEDARWIWQSVGAAEVTDPPPVPVDPPLPTDPPPADLPARVVALEQQLRAAESDLRALRLNLAAHDARLAALEAAPPLAAPAFNPDDYVVTGNTRTAWGHVHALALGLRKRTP